MSPDVVISTNFPNLTLVKRGKVRDMYDLDEYYLMVQTDRLSAFDVIMNEGIPNKGKVLTKISKFWFEYVKDIIENHVVSTEVDDFPKVCREYADVLKDRSMLVKKAELVPVECIVRGYITGSGWKDYKKSGSICGIKLPDGMVESEKFSEPLFTPSTKAEIGLHDENISRDEAIKIVGKDTYEFVENKTIEIYKKAAEYAWEKGIILADTKMEFGFYDGKIILIDELLTPDSSRFWPKTAYEKGKSQFSYDKQYVRDYLLSINFNKQPPAPPLPADVIENTSKKYIEAMFQLTGETL
ncbi:MAG: phosphoribosylaminoimidazolesuccinocarboxamide synthase [bacterium]